MTRIYKPLMLIVALLWIVGCQADSKTDADENVLVAPGKLDNYYSPTSQEYYVSGTSTVTLEESYRDKSDEDKMRRVRELVSLKHVSIGWFLNVYLVDKSNDADNKDYGGYHAMTRNGSYEDLKIELVEGLTYRFTFKQQVGGKTDLLTRLPTETDDQGVQSFVLKLKKVSNEEMSKLDHNNEWYRKYSKFDPSKFEADELEEVKLAITVQPRSDDAYLDYNKLYADGEVTIGIHFGWDYHSEYHIKHSESVYNYLIREGYKSPVASYDAYTRTSGPLTKTFKANGRDVVAKVWLFWGKTGTDTDPDTDAGGRVLEADMRESFKNREIIIFSGHSGNYYGFALANWKKTDEGDLDDSEIAGLEMPKNTYQIVAAIGCDTYSVGEAFFNNPNKSDRKNINVITTLSFSSASSDTSVRTMIDAVSGTDSDGNHNQVKTFKSVLQSMERSSWFFETMYGVYGVDNNPKVHPYADTTLLCKSCDSNSDCGGIGNQCTRLSPESKVCTSQCTGDDGCPDGYSCKKVATGSYITSTQCVPTSGSCKTEEPTPNNGPAILINELLADPPADISGDSNGDGTRNAVDDEFVELVNRSDKPVDLSGYTLADSFSSRFSFPNGTVLSPGQALLVFGGGDQSTFADFGRSLVFVSKGLGLNNSGDTITLLDASGRSVDSVTYGSEGGKDRALVRSTDGDPNAGFVSHPGSSPFSPGTKSDGTPF